MSRSYKKNPFAGIASHSDKPGKQLSNRMFRRREKNCITTWRLNRLPYSMNQVYNVWSMPKDGKFYFGDMKNNHTKFGRGGKTEHQWYKELMRK